MLYRFWHERPSLFEVLVEFQSCMTLVCWRSTSRVICAVFITSGHGPTSNVSVSSFGGLAFGLMSRSPCWKSTPCIQQVCNFHARFNASIHRKTSHTKVFALQFSISKRRKPLFGGKRHQAPLAPQPSLALLSICSTFESKHTLSRVNKEVTKEKKAPVFNTQMMSFSQERRAWALHK